MHKASVTFAQSKYHILSSAVSSASDRRGGAESMYRVYCQFMQTTSFIEDNLVVNVLTTHLVVFLLSVAVAKA